MIVPLLVLIGTAGGAGAVGWAMARRRDRRPQANPRALPGAVLGALPQSAYREPDRGAQINIPVDAEDFKQLSEAFCLCYEALVRDHGTPPAPELLRDTFLHAIYPEFTWPPVPGDPQSAQLLWLIADHEARKLVADPRSCKGGAG